MRRLLRNASMPILDAKALETDPEGMAFLRAVLKPAAEKQGSAPASDACAKPRRPFQVELPPQADMRMTPPAAETAAVAPAAA
jgi:hypothetical protein